MHVKVINERHNGNCRKIDPAVIEHYVCDVIVNCDVVPLDFIFVGRALTIPEVTDISFSILILPKITYFWISI